LDFITQIRPTCLYNDDLYSIVTIITVFLYYIILYYFPCSYIIFTQNQNRLFAQYCFLFAVTSSSCFGRIYWSSSGNHMQRRFPLFKEYRQHTKHLIQQFTTLEERGKTCLDTKHNLMLYSVTRCTQLYFNYIPTYYANNFSNCKHNMT